MKYYDPDWPPHSHPSPRKCFKKQRTLRFVCIVHSIEKLHLLFHWLIKLIGEICNHVYNLLVWLFCGPYSYSSSKNSMIILSSKSSDSKKTMHLVRSSLHHLECLPWAILVGLWGRPWPPAAIAFLWLFLSLVFTLPLLYFCCFCFSLLSAPAPYHGHHCWWLW